jgi:predicted kinase
MRDYIVLCGVTHSGKTTYAKRLMKKYPAKDYAYINTDGIRESLHGSREIKSFDEAAVWNLFEAAKRSALRDGRNIILDACHISKNARWHALNGVNGDHRKVCVVFNTPLKVIKKRVRKAKRLNEAVLLSMYSSFSMPQMTEGFDEIVNK